ncbi:MAG: hypothetical protein WDZ94_00080 [Patescibacteria group bacterium]
MKLEYQLQYTEKELTIITSRLGNLEEQLKRIVVESEYDDLIQSCLRYMIKDNLQTTQLMQGLANGNPDFIQHSYNFKYGKSEKSTARIAKDFLTFREVDEPRYDEQLFDARDIEKYFRLVLSRYGIEYNVVLSNNAMAIDVRDKSQTGGSIHIPIQKKVRKKRLIELISEEIESHCLQSSNARKMFGIGGGKLKYDEEILYEGYAMYNYSRLPKLFRSDESSHNLPFYIMPLLIDKASNGASFQDLFQEAAYLVEQYGAKKDAREINASAWKLVLRIKRGFKDLDESAGYYLNKDSGYMVGMLVCKDFVANGKEKYVSFLNFPLKLIPEFLKFSFDGVRVPYTFQNLAGKLRLD